MTDVRIVLEAPDGTLRKLTKIVPYKAGGFAVLMPYHSARRGWVGRVPVDYAAHTFKVARAACQEFSVGDRVKLSYHADGFAQFSSETPGRILSGRDPSTGQPKGLGLMTSPISSPVSSGPTFNVVAWGLLDFEEADGSGSGDLVFTERDLYYRGCEPSTANGYVVEGWVFPSRMWAGVRPRAEDGYQLLTAHHAFEATGAVLEWRVIPLPGQPAFVAVMASRLRVRFKAPSGFQLGCPGVRYPDGRGEVLMGLYPELWEDSIDAPTCSLDRPPAGAAGQAPIL